MNWIFMILGAYTLYYIVLIVFDNVKNSKPSADDDDTQIISVKDMLSAKSFKAKQMELSEKTRKEYLNKDKNDTGTYKPQRVTGAIYAQGFEVNNYNLQLMRNGKAAFDGFA